jgi:hypothetical protein
MFFGSIDHKANKLKLNVETYLNNDRKRESSYQQPVPSIKKPEQPPINSQIVSQPLQNSFPVQASTPSNAPLQARITEIDIKQMILQGKIYEKSPISLKSSIK